MTVAEVTAESGGWRTSSRSLAGDGAGACVQASSVEVMPDGSIWLHTSGERVLLRPAQGPLDAGPVALVERSALGTDVPAEAAPAQLDDADRAAMRAFRVWADSLREDDDTDAVVRALATDVVRAHGINVPPWIAEVGQDPSAAPYAQQMVWVVAQYLRTHPGDDSGAHDIAGRLAYGHLSPGGLLGGTPHARTSTHRAPVLRYDLPPGQWPPHDELTLQQSSRGYDGVFFASDARGATVIFKPYYEAAADGHYAGNFIREVGGVATPRVRTYAANSSDGLILRRLATKAAFADREYREDREGFSDVTHFLVFELIPGRETLTGERVLEFLSDESALFDLGRLMVIDSLLGNADDRYSEIEVTEKRVPVLKLHNIIYRPGLGIVAIDNLFTPFDDEAAAMIASDLTKFEDDDFIDNEVPIIHFLKNTKIDASLKDLLPSVRARIVAGINWALSEIGDRALELNERLRREQRDLFPAEYRTEPTRWNIKALAEQLNLRFSHLRTRLPAHYEPSTSTRPTPRAEAASAAQAALAGSVGVELIAGARTPIGAIFDSLQSTGGLIWGNPPRQLTRPEAEAILVRLTRGSGHRATVEQIALAFRLTIYVIGRNGGISQPIGVGSARSVYIGEATPQGKYFASRPVPARTSTTALRPPGAHAYHPSNMYGQQYQYQGGYTPTWTVNLDDAKRDFLDMEIKRRQELGKADDPTTKLLIEKRQEWPESPQPRPVPPIRGPLTRPASLGTPKGEAYVEKDSNGVAWSISSLSVFDKNWEFVPEGQRKCVSVALVTLSG